MYGPAGVGQALTDSEVIGTQIFGPVLDQYRNITPASVPALILLNAHYAAKSIRSRMAVMSVCT